MFTKHKLPLKGPKNAIFPWWPWPFTLTFKLFRARDQTRLACEFGANPLNGSPRHFIHKQKSHRQRQQAGWFLRPKCAPSSECPRTSIAACRRTAGSIRISCRASCCCSSAIAGIAIGANFKIYLLRQFCSNWVQFFYNIQETQMQKMMNQNSEIWIWTIMVAAKLDQSGVLVTKFHQNRSTLKGRSAGQRQTDKLGWK